MKRSAAEELVDDSLRKKRLIDAPLPVIIDLDSDSDDIVPSDRNASPQQIAKAPKLTQVSIMTMFAKNIPQVIKENIDFGTSIVKTVQSSLHSYFTGGKPPPKPAQEPDPPIAPKSTTSFFPIFSKGFDSGNSTSSNSNNSSWKSDRAPSPSQVRDAFPPFYKRVPTTDFMVDSFVYRYSKMADRAVYFLTHFHSDHYGRLDASYDWGPLYCSPITANLLQLKLGVKRTYIHVIELNTPTIINDVTVTFLDANHCPGSVMILFRLPSGLTHLHTGDFRYSPTVQDHLNCANLQIQNLYLDTTYSDPQYVFPPQREVIDTCIRSIENDVKRADTIIVFGTYTIGKERIIIDTALRYGCKIYVTPAKYKIIECLNYSPSIMRLFTRKVDEAKIHVVPLWDVGMDKLAQYLKTQSWPVARVVGVKPTGWTFGANAKTKTTQTKGPKKQTSKDFSVTIWSLPYSEHSSFNELKEFVKLVNAKHVIPTVCNNNSESAKQIVAQLTS